MIWRLSSIGPQVSGFLYSHSSKVQVSLLQYRYLATLLRRAQVLPFEELEQRVDWRFASLCVAKSQQKSETNSAIYRIKGVEQLKCTWPWCFPLHFSRTSRQMHWRGTHFPILRLFFQATISFVKTSLSFWTTSWSSTARTSAKTRRFTSWSTKSEPLRT